MRKEGMQVLHALLKDVREVATAHRAGMSNPNCFQQECGICYAIETLRPRDADAPTVAQLCKAAMAVARRWPKYSGYPQFPVPDADTQRDDPSAAFMDPHDVWVGPYGDMRMELLDFLIEQTKDTTTNEGEAAC